MDRKMLQPAGSGGRFGRPLVGSRRLMADDRKTEREPHHDLGNPASDPDPTEWPDPYERREDPRDPPDPDEEPFGEQGHPQTGSTSTSEPHPSEDPEAPDWEGPKRDKLDE
jgi:hypothetical protein